MATVLLRMKSRAGRGWETRAEESLLRALDVDPSHKKAHYRLGRLYADSSIRDFEKAKEHLKKSEPDPWSFFHRAKILAEEEGDLASAVDLLRRSISLRPHPDFRHADYFRYALELLRAGELDLGDLDPAIRRHARREAERLLHGLDPNDKEWFHEAAERFLEEVAPRPEEPPEDDTEEHAAAGDVGQHAALDQEASAGISDEAPADQETERTENPQEEAQ